MQQLVIESAEEMRRKHFPNVSVGEYNEQNDYLAYLRSKGVELNSKLFPSVFKLKNGLPYVGMAVREPVSGGEVLIRVPEQLILSSGKAIHESSLSEVFQDSFFNNDNVTWEDRAIIVYCLFLLHQKNEENPWYQMVRRFPKECDIACFWSEEQLGAFRDQSVRNAVLLDITSFEQQWAEFVQLQKRYEILQGEQFNKQNYRIIFITGINRSFGGDMSFVSLVPFAELFNHHCSKAYFGLEREKETYFLREQEDEVSSSGSCESEEYIEGGEFEYDSIESLTFNWEVKESYDLVKKQKQKIQSQTQKLLNLIDKELNWENFTILVMGPFMLKLKVNLKEFLVGRKQFMKAQKQVQAIGQSLQLFKTLIQKYFQRANKKSYWKKPQKPSVETTVKSTLAKKLQKQYESLIIKTEGDDVFERNNQIYFRYGSNSNRTLLLHYGFAIEGNKYEHIWVTLSIKKYLSQFPDVLDKVMEKKLSLLRKFKFYNHRLNIDLIIFFRLNNWTFYGEKAVEEIFAVTNIPKQIAVLQQIRSILQEKKTVYEGNYDLSDKSLNYHQYFTTVYHLQKLNILKKQILLLNKLIQILVKVKNGQKIAKLSQSLTRSQKYILMPYIESIRQ